MPLDTQQNQTKPGNVLSELRGYATKHALRLHAT